jgi:hypothetical protein
MITREEAKTAYWEALARQPLASVSDDTKRLIRKVSHYFDQEPEDPDAEVWAIIHDQLSTLKEQGNDGKRRWLATNNGMSWLLLAKTAWGGDGEFVGGFPGKTLGQMFQQFEGMLSEPKPTLETIQAAHEETQKKLAITEGVVKRLRGCLRMQGEDT